MIYFCDTSALLNGCTEHYPNIWITPLIVSELENIKNSQKNDEVKYRARKLTRDMITSSNYKYYIPETKKINKIIKKNKYLSDIADHKLVAAACLLQEEMHESVTFVTSDYALYLLHSCFPQLGWRLWKDNALMEYEENQGWKNYTPSNAQLASLYSDPTANVLHCITNEFAKIYEGDDLKDILFWTGERYRPLKYKEIKNHFLNETIKPRNLEQKMAFDLLQNDSIKVKLLTSAWGSGKTMIALNYALEQIYRGVYKKLVFVRNNIIVADTNDIGFLPGTMTEKMSIWGGPIADHLGGTDVLEQMIEDGIIEIYPISHIRGRSIKNSILLCDECENLNDKLVTLLLSRMEDNSEIIFCGDVAQIDNKKFEKNNGIKSMLDHLSGDPLFGTVKLIKSERGRIPQLCDKMIPPK